MLLVYINIYAYDKNIEKAGDIVQILIPTTAYMTTWAIDDKAGRDEFYVSFAGNILATHGLKRAIQRERPNKADNHSMPSGHTSASFHGATFIHKRYGLGYAIVPYIGAAFVGYSSVYSKWHYRSDVYAGALLGSAFAWFFTTPYESKERTIEPVAYMVDDKNFYGVKIRW